MKFAIAFVIGDTELHDKLCGQYGVRNDKVKRLCRHCNYPTSEITNPKKQKTTKIYVPSDFDIEKEKNNLVIFNRYRIIPSIMHFII